MAKYIRECMNKIEENNELSFQLYFTYSDNYCRPPCTISSFFFTYIIVLYVYIIVVNLFFIHSAFPLS